MVVVGGGGGLRELVSVGGDEPLGGEGVRVAGRVRLVFRCWVATVDACLDLMASATWASYSTHTEAVAASVLRAARAAASLPQRLWSSESRPWPWWVDV